MKLLDAQLILVYNADGDKVSVLLDVVHKIVSPSTYKCTLCKVTYGAFSMHARWREFLREFARKPVEYHRDEFVAKFPGSMVRFPAILVRFGDEAPRVLITSVGLETITEIDELIEMVRSRLRDTLSKRQQTA